MSWVASSARTSLFIAWLLLFLLLRGNKADVEWFWDKALSSFARLRFSRSTHIAEARNYKQSLGSMYMLDSCHIVDATKRTLWSILFMSLSPFCLISLLLSLCFILFKKVGCLRKKRKLSVIYYSFLFLLFLYSISFALLCLSLAFLLSVF